MPCRSSQAVSSLPSLNLKPKSSQPWTWLILANGIHRPCSGVRQRKASGNNVVIARQGAAKTHRRLEAEPAEAKPGTPVLRRQPEVVGQVQLARARAVADAEQRRAGRIDAQREAALAVGHGAQRIAREAAVGAGLERVAADQYSRPGSTAVLRRGSASQRSPLPATGRAKTSVIARSRFAASSIETS